MQEVHCRSQSGYQSTNLNILGDNVPTEEETTSHCQIVQEIRRNQWKSAILYLPTLGSHFTIWSPFSKYDKVMSRTRFCSCPAFSVERKISIHGKREVDAGESEQ